MMSYEASEEAVTEMIGPVDPGRTGGVASPRRHPEPGVRRRVDRARLADVAELYWIRQHKIETIARETGDSKSTVSRLLAQARDEGVIEFVVHRTRDDIAPLQTALQASFGVETLIPRDASQADEPLRRLLVGREAALWLAALVRPGMSVGVTWGRTTEAVSLHLRKNHVDDVRIVQVHGSANVAAIGVNYAGRILGRFGDAFDATVHLLPLPTMFDSAATREAMWHERTIRDALSIRRAVDLVVTSVGTSDHAHASRLYRSGLLDERDMRELRRQHVIGNLASVFFRRDASTDGISVNDRATGIPFDEFRRITTRLFVVADPHKADATRALLEAGMVTHLVTDADTAAAILGHR